MSPFKGTKGIRRLVNATGYSLNGLKGAWRNEAAFRQIVVLAILGIGLAFWLSIPPWGRALLVMSHLLCVVVELINSAIEAAVDHTSLEFHALAKLAKDLGSAAQMVGLLNVAVVWVLVLVP